MSLHHNYLEACFELTRVTIVGEQDAKYWRRIREMGLSSNLVLDARAQSLSMLAWIVQAMALAKMKLTPRHKAAIVRCLEACNTCLPSPAVFRPHPTEPPDMLAMLAAAILMNAHPDILETYSRVVYERDSTELLAKMQEHVKYSMFPPSDRDGFYVVREEIDYSGVRKESFSSSVHNESYTAAEFRINDDVHRVSTAPQSTAAFHRSVVKNAAGIPRDVSQDFMADAIDLRIIYAAVATLFLTDRPRSQPTPGGRVGEWKYSGWWKRHFSADDRDALLRTASACWSSYQGGFGMEPESEAHTGYTFCGVALIGALEGWAEACIQVQGPGPSLEKWLSDRFLPDGGCNGRDGKRADVCYSFWALASWVIAGLPMEHQRLLLVAMKYKIAEECVNQSMGGISKTPEAPPDPFHTYFGLAAMELLHNISSPEAEVFEPYFAAYLPQTI